MTIPIDRHFFIAETKKIEASVVESIVQKVSICAAMAFPDWKINALARRFSDEAFKKFEKEVTQKFSSEEYASLISLIIMSRAKYFVITLPELLKIKMTPSIFLENQDQMSV